MSFTYNTKPTAQRLAGGTLLTLLVLTGCDSDFPATVTPPPPPPPPGMSAPVVDNQAFTTREDTELTETIVATDPDGDTVTFAVMAGNGPTMGELTSFDTATGMFTYLPERDFEGDDTFSVNVSDGVNTTSAVITITVACDAAAGQQCGFDKFDLVDDPALTGAGEPSIAVDTLVRVNVAFTEDNTAAGGTASDLFVFQTAIAGRTFTKTPGSGPNGALNDGAAAARPDLIGALVPATGVAVAWDEADNIFVEARDDVVNPGWADISGNPNSTAALDPVLSLDLLTGVPVVIWTGAAALLGTDILAASNSGPSILAPGTWDQLDGPLDVTALNSTSLPTAALDDIPGGGTNVAGRTTIAFVETQATIGQIFVKQCPNITDGMAANCVQLGGSLNESATTSATTPDITIPNAATAILIGDSPTNPRPVTAFVEDGQLYVKRYDPGTDSWSILSDSDASASLNISEADGVAADPAIVTDVLGRYTVVWSEANATTGRTGVYAKRFDATNAGVGFVGLEGLLNCDPDQPATAPDVAVDTTGRPYITFVEEDVNGETRIVVLSFEN